MSGVATTASDSILWVILQESWILDYFEIFVSIALKGEKGTAGKMNMVTPPGEWYCLGGLWLLSSLLIISSARNDRDIIELLLYCEKKCLFHCFGIIMTFHQLLIFFSDYKLKSEPDRWAIEWLCVNACASDACGSTRYPRVEWGQVRVG